VVLVFGVVRFYNSATVEDFGLIRASGQFERAKPDAKPPEPEKRAVQGIAF
jgi:hypothetical protein